MLKILVLFSCFLFTIQIALACESAVAPPQDSTKRYSLVALPIVAFTPETDWIFGGAGSLSFRFKGEPQKSRPSQVLMGGAYTLKKQILSYLNYQLFYKEEKYKLYGELGYYLYTYPYFGVGNDLREEDLENYEALYPRVRINALYLIRPQTYIGLRYWMDDFKIKDSVAGGLLETTGGTGVNGGLLSGLGIVFNFDSRDNIFFSGKGKYVELVLFANSPNLGSDFSFTKYTLDASTYHSNRLKHTLAVNVYTEFTFGDVPFNQMALIGGTKRMRGLIEGRFRDKHMMLLQAEYRIPIFWRFGLVVFGGTGRVANEVNELTLDALHYNFGGGIRFVLDKKEKLNLRFDVGRASQETGFYLTFGEAF